MVRIMVAVESLLHAGEMGAYACGSGLDAWKLARADLADFQVTARPIATTETSIEVGWSHSKVGGWLPPPAFSTRPLPMRGAHAQHVNAHRSPCFACAQEPPPPSLPHNAAATRSHTQQVEALHIGQACPT